jgi:hypothetical protein
MATTKTSAALDGIRGRREAVSLDGWRYEMLMVPFRVEVHPWCTF